MITVCHFGGWLISSSSFLSFCVYLRVHVLRLRNLIVKVIHAFKSSSSYEGFETKTETVFSNLDDPDNYLVLLGKS